MEQIKTKLNIKLEVVTRITRYCLVLSSLFYLLLYLYIALHRLYYPFELEWMEGGMVDHIVRLLSGKQLYAEPSIEFTPYIYTPLFYYVGVIFSKIFGVGFFSLRLISFFASLGCFGIIFILVNKETKSPFFGLLSMGLFAATYRIGGAWMDIARVDSLFLFLLLSGCYLLRFYDTALSLIGSALLVFLSFFTKQTGLIIVFPMCFYTIIYLPKWKKIIFPATFLLCFIISTNVMDYESQGWYSYYVFKLPAQHKLLTNMVFKFWIHYFKYFSVAFIFSVTCFFFMFCKFKRKRNGYYIVFFLSMFGASWISILHQGGYDNVLLPAYSAVSILFGIGMWRVTDRPVIRLPQHNYTIPQNMALVSFIVFIVFLTQFYTLHYSAFAQCPPKRNLEAGSAFIAKVKEMKGDVFIPSHGYLPSLAGKESYAHWMALEDVLRGNDEKIRNRLLGKLVNAIKNKKFEAIIIDGNLNSYGEVGNEISQNYTLSSKMFNSKEIFFTVTGVITRPEWIYIKSK